MDIIDYQRPETYILSPPLPSHKMEQSALTLFKREDRIPELSSLLPSRRMTKVLSTHQLQLESRGEQQQQQQAPPMTVFSGKGSQKLGTPRGQHKMSSVSGGMEKGGPKSARGRRESSQGGVMLKAMREEEEREYYAQNLAETIDMEMLEDLDFNDEKTLNILHAIRIRKEKVRHSDFYFLLEQVNDRIHMYKSLFLDKKPKFIKEQQQPRVNSQDLQAKKLKAVEDERKLKVQAQLREKKKKNKFYEQLSKNNNKKFKPGNFISERKTGFLLTDLGSGSGAMLMSNTEYDTLKANHMKEQQRKEKLYAQKPKGLQINPSQQELSIVQQDSVRGSVGDQSRNLMKPMDSMGLVKNDISYLNSMKQSQSLPYLKHFKQLESTPLHSYVEQKLKASQETEEMLIVDSAAKKNKKLLRLGERKFSKLNQKASLKGMLGQEGMLTSRTHRQINENLLPAVTSTTAYTVSMKVLPVMQSYEKVVKIPQLKDLIIHKLAKLKPLNFDHNSK